MIGPAAARSSRHLLDKEEAETLTPVVNPANDIATMTEPRRVTAGVEMSF